MEAVRAFNNEVYIRELYLISNYLCLSQKLEEDSQGYNYRMGSTPVVAESKHSHFHCCLVIVSYLTNKSVVLHVCRMSRHDTRLPHT